LFASEIVAERNGIAEQAESPQASPSAKDLARHLLTLDESEWKDALVLAAEGSAADLLELRRKSEFYDAVTQTDEWIDLRTAAQALNIDGVGQNALFAILRDRNILMDYSTNWNEPYQRYVHRGYFKVVVERHERFGKERLYYKTVVSPKGLEFIRRELLEHTADRDR